MDTIAVHETGGQVARLVWEWESDGSGNAVGRTAAPVPGLIFSAALLPGGGSGQPSANYDVVVRDVFNALGGGTSVLNADRVDGALENRSNAAPELVSFWPDSVRTTSGMVQINVTNAGANKVGRIELMIARFLGLKVADVDVPLTGGGDGKVLQYAGPAQGKWVALSGQAEMVDGGAVTLKGSPTFAAVSVTGNLGAASANISGNAALGTVEVAGLATLLDLLVSGANVNFERATSGVVVNLSGYRNVGYGAAFVGSIAGGTKMTPTIIAEDQEAFVITGVGYDGTGDVELARVIFAQDGVPTGGAMAGKIIFQTCDPGTNQLRTVAELDKTGKLTTFFGVRMPGLPTSASGLATGDLWNDGGTVKVVL